MVQYLLRRDRRREESLPIASAATSENAGSQEGIITPDAVDYKVDLETPIESPMAGRDTKGAILDSQGRQVRHQ